MAEENNNSIPPNLPKNTPWYAWLIAIVIGSPVVTLITQEFIDRNSKTPKDPVENKVPNSSTINTSETYPDGSTYIGQVLNGQRHGQGKYIASNGDIYEGQWFNDRYHGIGIYTWKNGDIYQGQWVNGLKHGQGTWSGFDGNVIKGTWANDRIIN